VFAHPLQAFAPSLLPLFTNHAESPVCAFVLQGNVGLIFTKGDLKEVRDEITKYKVGAPARVGLVAPIDVVVPPGNTGLDPSQTSFFQVRRLCCLLVGLLIEYAHGLVTECTPVDWLQSELKVGSFRLFQGSLVTEYAHGLWLQSRIVLVRQLLQGDCGLFLVGKAAEYLHTCAVRSWY
jgi:hypothetical protein